MLSDFCCLQDIAGICTHWPTDILLKSKFLFFLDCELFQRGYTLIIVCQWWKY